MPDSPARPDVEALREALRDVIDPELHRDVVDLGMVGELSIDPAGAVQVEIILTTPGCPLKSNLRDQVHRAVTRLPGVASVRVEFGAMDQAQREALRARLTEGRRDRSPGIAVPDDCRVIAVTSGKGGVGKSTVTVNLALALAARGHRIGVMDADVYGYSIPQMLGIRQRPVTVDRMIVPPVAHGVSAVSIGFFLEEDAAVMWRGPMLHRALEQFLGDVHWGELDVLVVDMPPGTGDVAISLGQLLPRAECLVVTTPQVAAQSVARRAALTALKLGQQVLGVVENMAGDADGGPGMFGAGGGELLADELSVPVLGRVPLESRIREGGDSGVPVTVDPAGDSGEPFRALAAAVEERRPRTLGPVPLGMDATAPPAPAATTAMPSGAAARIKKPLGMV